jgi:acetolactate synthase-1/2/3 large subunit
VAITGQVPSALIGTDAFQEVDTYGLSLPITKHNFLVRDAAELLEVIPAAFHLAESGRPGPVVVDVPKDVQMQSVEFERWPEPARKDPPVGCDPDDIARLAEMIHKANRPVLYIGGGIITSGCSKELRQLALQNSIPVTSTLMGLGAFPAGDPLDLGMLGMHGSRFTNHAIEEADLLLALGVRFDDRATGKVAEFCPNAAIAHIDIDPAEIDKIKTSALSTAGDVGEAMRQLIKILPEDNRSSWHARLDELRRTYPIEWPAPEQTGHPLNWIRALGERLEPADIVTTDVGQHQMWAAQAYPVRAPRTWLTSGGLGTMGFGLPAAIGAALEKPEQRTVCITGDGSLLMNIQELATLADLQLPVKIFLFNNGHLGLVRQQQELFYGRRYHAVEFETSPDFVTLARSFGLEAHRMKPADATGGWLDNILTAPGPCLVDLPIQSAENVFPMVPPGGANREMIGGEIHA